MVCCGEACQFESWKEGGYRTRHRILGKWAVVKRQNMWGFNHFFFLNTTNIAISYFHSSVSIGALRLAFALHLG